MHVCMCAETFSAPSTYLKGQPCKAVVRRLEANAGRNWGMDQDNTLLICLHCLVAAEINTNSSKKCNLQFHICINNSVSMHKGMT